MLAKHKNLFFPNLAGDALDDDLNARWRAEPVIVLMVDCIERATADHQAHGQPGAPGVAAACTGQHSHGSVSRSAFGLDTNTITSARLVTPRALCDAHFQTNLACLAPAAESLGSMHAICWHFQFAGNDGADTHLIR